MWGGLRVFHEATKERKASAMGEAAHQEVQEIQERASSARRRSRNQGGPDASSYSSYMSYTSYRDACWHVADVPGCKENEGAR